MQKQWDFANRAENSFNRQLDREMRRCPTVHGIEKVLVFLELLMIFPTMLFLMKPAADFVGDRFGR
jgi:hypothetical protein